MSTNYAGHGHAQGHAGPGGQGAGHRSAALPDFPNLKHLRLPSTMDSTKAATFVVMYRTHCQRLLDTMVRANFDDVQALLLHFWQGVPSHLSPLLGSPGFVSLLGACDVILYKTVATILLPTTLQTLPEVLARLVRKFASELDYWFKVALFNVPDGIRSVKLDLARRFSRLLRRLTSISHLSQAARMVVANCELMAQMVRDWRTLDIEAICRETLFVAGEAGEGLSRETTFGLMRQAYHDFEKILDEENRLELFVEWIDNIVQRAVVFPAYKDKRPVRGSSRTLLFVWSAIGSRIIRDLTLSAAPSFSSFHLLRLMFDEYLLYLIEFVHLDEMMGEFLSKVPSDEIPVFSESYFSEAFVPEGDGSLAEAGHPHFLGHEPYTGCECAISSDGNAMDGSTGENFSNSTEHGHGAHGYAVGYASGQHGGNSDPGHHHGHRAYPWTYSTNGYGGYQSGSETGSSSAPYATVQHNSKENELSQESGSSSEESIVYNPYLGPTSVPNPVLPGSTQPAESGAIFKTEAYQGSSSYNYL